VFPKAIEIARRQSAKSLNCGSDELRVRLWQQQGKKKKPGRCGGDFGWFTEDSTADLKEAKRSGGAGVKSSGKTGIFIKASVRLTIGPTERDPMQQK